MALNNYSSLRTSIREWLDRGDELDDYIDDFILLAEERHRKDLRLRTMLKRAPIIVNKRYLTLPNRFLEATTFRLLTDPVTELQQIPIEQMTRERVETQQRPASFTVHAEIEMNSIPDQSYTGEMVYYEQVLPLSNSVSSNTILSSAPGCYLYGALVAATPHLMHDERINVWENLYAQARDNANGVSRNQQIIGPPRARVLGVVP